MTAPSETWAYEVRCDNAQPHLPHEWVLPEHVPFSVTPGPVICIGVPKPGRYVERKFEAPGMVLSFTACTDCGLYVDRKPVHEQWHAR